MYTDLINVKPEMWMMIGRSWSQMSQMVTMTNNLSSEASSSVKVSRIWFGFGRHHLGHLAHDGLELCGALVLSLLHQRDPVLELAGVAPRHDVHGNLC